MDPKNIILLQRCIEHWNYKAHEWKIETGANECPLCQEYLLGKEDGMQDCTGCPVYIATSGKHCHTTPYDDVCDAEDELEDSEEWRIFEMLFDSIEEEVEFLISLLPEQFAKEYDV